MISTFSPSFDDAQRIDLSVPDNTELVRGRSRWFEALWVFLGAPLLASRVITSCRFRALLLRFFGAEVGVRTHIKPGVRVKFPWYLSIGDYAWIGEDVWIDNLAQVSIGSHVCISQGVYICTGNHDWSTPNMRLFRRPITLERGSWIGVRAIVCPGVVVGAGSVLTAGSVATRQLQPLGIYTGNPATWTKQRTVGD